jgi:hypothetical protein
VLVTEPFAAVARASAAARGLPDLPIVVLPADLDDLAPGKVAEVIRSRWPEMRRAWARGEDGTA